jgi:hypothetical protein
MTAPYRGFTDRSEMLDLIRDLSAVTVVFDVEPLIAYWDTDQQTLAAGVTAILDQLAAEPGKVRHVVFATNSTRNLPTPPHRGSLHVEYRTLARKPLRRAPSPAASPATAPLTQSATSSRKPAPVPKRPPQTTRMVTTWPDARHRWQPAAPVTAWGTTTADCC